MDSSSFFSPHKVDSYILTPAAVVQIHKHEPGKPWKSMEETTRVGETDQSISSLQAEHSVKIKQNKSQV